VGMHKKHFTELDPMPLQSFSSDVFFPKKKDTIDLRKELKTMSMTKQSEWFFGLFVYYKLPYFFCSPSFFLKKFTVVSAKKKRFSGI
jgi:hypothetical protein